jgi:hypothetical protein
MKIFFENLIFAQGEKFVVSSSLPPIDQARQEYVTPSSVPVEAADSCKCLVTTSPFILLLCYFLRGMRPISDVILHLKKDRIKCLSRVWLKENLCEQCYSLNIEFRVSVVFIGFFDIFLILARC